MDFPLEILWAHVECDLASGRIVWLHRSPSMFPLGAYCRDRKASSWNAKNAGKPAFNSLNDKGYLVGTLMAQRVLAHRVVFTFGVGHPPIGEIDHINGRRSDNRFNNLRDVSPLENAQNCRLKSTNKTGVSGVLWRARDQVWSASIGHKYRKVWLGQFETKAEAVTARLMAERAFGFHENHGRIAPS